MKSIHKIENKVELATWGNPSSKCWRKMDDPLDERIRIKMNFSCWTDIRERIFHQTIDTIWLLSTLKTKMNSEASGYNES